MDLLIWIHVSQTNNDGIYSYEPPEDDHTDRNM
jgi:hypothetical protein